jgi:lycopene cyclase domain-containing protein
MPLEVWVFGQWSYLAILGFVVVASFWLEFAFRLRVLRDPKRLIKTLAFTIPPFVLWDAYAIAQGHWFFDPEKVTGIVGPLNVPLEEYLFFVVVPIAALLTLEGVSNFLPTVRRWIGALKGLSQ